MTYENFLKITLGLKKASEDINQLYKNKVDLIEFVEPYHEIIMTTLREIYTEEGIDWLQWFMYENEFGQKDWGGVPQYKEVDGKMVKVDVNENEPRFGATDADGKPICYDFESTYEFLKQYRK
jgi:hypothetical protein